MVFVGTIAASGAVNCTFTAHPNVTFLGNMSLSKNVIECFDHEGLAHCQQRCEEDDSCAGFGLYVRGERLGRCCTKSNNLGPHQWTEGVSYTKNINPPMCPAPPSSVPVNVSIIFRGNASFAYNKGAMIQALPGGLLAASCQAGDREASSNQRILYALSPDNGRSWPGGWAQVTPEPEGAREVTHSPTSTGTSRTPLLSTSP